LGKEAPGRGIGIVIPNILARLGAGNGLNKLLLSVISLLEVF